MTISVRAAEFLIFDVDDLPGPTPARYCVVFSPAATVVPERLLDHLKRHFDDSVPPDQILLIGGAYAEASLRAAAGNEAILRNIPAITRYVNTPTVLPVAFDANGRLQDLANLATQPTQRSSAFSSRIQQQGLLQIFKERHGILKAASGFHYIKPSGRHTDRFIRTGNVLLYGTEVAFIAWGLMQWLPKSLRRIYTDTASINSVAYALVAMRRAIDPSFEPPSIDSFSSYSGLGRVELEDARESLCLISASTSGGLEVEVEKKNRIPRDRVVTLFYCGPPTENSKILCDLTRRQDRDGVPPIQSFAESDCPHCLRGSTRVRISGDQFLPSDPQVTKLLITAKHAPPWLSETMKSFLGRDVVRVHHDGSGSRRGARQIYLHLEQMFGDQRGESASDFSVRLEGMLARSVPAMLAAVVHLDDASSVAFSKRILDIHRLATGRELDNGRVLSASQVLASPKDYEFGTGTILVIASAIAAGRELLAVSQALRKIYPHGPLAFMVGVARTPTKKVWHEVQSNLAYGRIPNEHPVHVVYAGIHTPDRSAGGTPWDEERRFLQELFERAELAEQVGPVRELIERRIAAINAAEGEVGGLRDDLFLPTASGGSLKLRTGFVFWGFSYDPPKTTQAEVFFTVSAVLHGLREGEGNTNLAQHEHVRTVVSPGCFSRFNDGVVQASLLRATLRSEMDYSHDEATSAQMRDVLQAVFQSLELEAGEAGPEFLLALAQGRLQLASQHVKELQLFLRRKELPTLLALLLTRWEGQAGAHSSGDTVSVQVEAAGDLGDEIHQAEDPPAGPLDESADGSGTDTDVPDASDRVDGGRASESDAGK